MIEIKSFATNKGNATNNNNTSNNGYANSSSNSTTVISGVNGVRLWGQYHDHTEDISGNMTGVGSISATGNINTSGNVVGNQVQATTVTSTHIVSNDGQIGSLTGGSIHTTGDITTDANLNADNINTNTINVSEELTALSAHIATLISGNITVDNLTVTQAAHFFKLIIDEVKAAKGQIIVTPANAVVDKVTFSNNKYYLYFRATDGEKKIQNMFEVNDQILCQTFDVATGTNYNVSNKFYWAKCIYVSSTPVDTTIDGEEVKCHMIQLDWTDKATNTNAVPEAGDEIVMLGNRTDTTRQAAISIGAYNNPLLDNGITAPFIIQYGGINDYNLSTHRVNVISNGYNYFKGTFTTSTGDDIEDLINDVSAGTTAYMHTAYANSADGQQNFSKTYFNNALYIGFCSNHTQSDSSLVYSDYTWARLKGDNGTNASNYLLESETHIINVDQYYESSTPDFYVRGYVFDPVNGKTQVNYNADIQYIFLNPEHNYQTTNQQLPILISPESEQTLYDLELQVIRIKMKDENNVNFVAQLDIPIVKDGENGYDGEDAVEYKLIPIEEKAYIDANGKVGVKLSYNIVEIIGTTYSLVTTSSSGYHVGYKAHNTQSVSASWSYLPYNTTNPQYVNANYANNWHTTANHLEYLEVCLLYGQGNPQIIGDDEVIDRRIVYAQLQPSATFSITDEIKSVVQGHTTSINALDGRITTNTNSISTIQQQYNQISSTVSSHTTSIDNLSGRVTQNETDISNITQRADSIESTVQNLKTGSKNLFNFTYCRWQNAVPFVKAYGIEGKGTRTRIYKLGFDGVGGDFSVSCWMKMKNSSASVNVNLCDVNDTEHMYSNVTTTWKYFTFTFSNVQQYIGDALDINNFNGFIDFESANISSSNRLYVRELMIVRGNIPSDFNVSWKDYENANTDNLFNFTYIDTIQPTGETYKGYPIYSPTTYNTNDGEFTDYIYKNQLSLKTNTPYTLTFYARCDYPCIIESFLYGNSGCVDGTCGVINNISNAGDISISNFSDGLTSCNIGTTWNKYIIHWYNQNSGQRNVIAYRDSADNWSNIDHTPNLQIAGVEFREGYWDDSLMNSQSLIRQTANEIELKVNATGIDITNGSITLNAENTTIIGNLNLKDSNQGLIIYDTYNNPKITVQNETLGNLDDFDFGSDKRFTAQTTSTVNSLTYNVALPSISLGNFNAGQKLNIHDIYVQSYNNQFYFDTIDHQTVAYSYDIKCGNTTVATVTGTAVRDRYEWKLNNYTNNAIPSTGLYYVDINLTCTLNNADFYGGFSHKVRLYAERTLTNINKIATDGALFSSSGTQYNWLGNDQTYIRNGASAIRIKDGKLQRNEYDAGFPSYNSNFSDISTTLPYHIINERAYRATADDGIIVFSTVMDTTDSAERILFLPQPSNYTGKIFYIKNIVGNNTTLQVFGDSSTDKHLMGAATNSTSNTLSIGNKATMVISCGFYWLVFNCG